MLIRSNKKGLSTVFGVLLFLILISAIASSLYVTLYRYNDNIQEGDNYRGRSFSRKDYDDEYRIIATRIHYRSKH